MSTASIEAYYAAFNRGDFEGMLELVTDDVVHDINQGAREVGKVAFRRFLERMDASYREQLKDVVIFTDGAQRAAAEYTVHGTYLASDEGLPPARGQAYLLPGGAFFTLSGDKIARVTNYYNLPSWLAQVSE